MRPYDPARDGRIAMQIAFILRGITELGEDVVAEPEETAKMLMRLAEDTGTSFLVCNVETDQAAFVERVARTHPNVKVRVNLDPAVVVCRDVERIYRGVDRVLEIVGGRTNCVMGTGALPLETPVENVRVIRDYLANRAEDSRTQ